MREFELLTKEGCPSCEKAKKLLQDEGHNYTANQLNEYNRDDFVSEMKKYGKNTFPLIFEMVPNGRFKDAVFVGGFEDLERYLDDEL